IYYRIAPDHCDNMVDFALVKGGARVFTFSVQNALQRKQLETLEVSIRSILVNHKKTDFSFSGSNSGSDSKTTPLRLAYDENNIVFNYNSSSLSNPSNVSYKT